MSGARDRPRIPAVILISGRGSNMMALVEAAASPDYPIEFVAIIANRPAAPGVAWARERGVAWRSDGQMPFSNDDAKVSI